MASAEDEGKENGDGKRTEKESTSKQSSEVGRSSESTGSDTPADDNDLQLVERERERRLSMQARDLKRRGRLKSEREERFDTNRHEDSVRNTDDEPSAERLPSDA